MAENTHLSPHVGIKSLWKLVTVSRTEKAHMTFEMNVFTPQTLQTTSHKLFVIELSWEVKIVEDPCKDRYSFREARKYITYRLAERSSTHDEDVVKSNAEWGTRFGSSGEVDIFNSFDSISIFSFFYAFKLDCDMKGTNKGALMWLLHLFLKTPAASTSNKWTSLVSMWHMSRKEGTITSHEEVVN